MWNKVYFFLFICLMSTSFLYSQTLTGKVLDKKTKAPIIYASVYFDNTTIGTTTDEDGTFIINNEAHINTPLVVTVLGYKKVIINTPNYNKVNIVLLEESPDTLDEVIITNDDWPRAIKLKEFKTHFLGTTKNGKSCEILNEDDLILRYNKHTKQLIATAKRPLTIKNKNLNYLITYDLQDFYVDYNYVSGNTRNYKSAYFAGTSFFQRLENQPTYKIEKKRQKTFEGFIIHFMRSLSRQQLQQDEYLLFDGKFQTSPDKFIAVNKIDSINVYKISITPDPKILQLRKDNPYIDFKNRPIPPKALSILYKTNRQSKFQPRVLEFIIDKNGNHYPPDAISFGGDMGEGRFGNTLPLDYQMSLILKK